MIFSRHKFQPLEQNRNVKAKTVTKQEQELADKMEQEKESTWEVVEEEGYEKPLPIKERIRKKNEVLYRTRSLLKR